MSVHGQEVQNATKAIQTINAFDSPEEIAEFLERQDIKGELGNPYTCAVAQYVNQSSGLPNDHVAVGTEAWVWLPSGDARTCGVLTFDLSESALSFVQGFDDGRFPNLMSDDDE